MEVAKSGQSCNGLLLYVDTNLVGSDAAEVRELLRLHEAGLLQLQRTDTVDTELIGATDHSRKSQLLEESAGLVESFGAFVLDHSRLDHAVLGGSMDEMRLEQVFSVLFPNAQRSRNNLRDAMHISTAIRYGANGFVTQDKRVLKRQGAIRDAFDGFLLLTPREAVILARRLAARAESRGDPQDR